ncbi:hypothetical protein E2562_007554 [Oryza meyeriana var. granulata]|uniref:F-box domain-containing protein n=1 Tax=Oryza meyeriana var. granulata TaxID=110450 RepID=A0A6G1DVC2_9ORYZ|nr:hypothetical protein E2562_007554 [Oryza meyeriana var. granulata]
MVILVPIDCDGNGAALVPEPMKRDGVGDRVALRFCDLPDDILASILARLRDTKTAAGTTNVLSHRWSFVWTGYMVPLQMLKVELLREGLGVVMKEGSAFELPCFTRATKIMLSLVFPGLSLPPSSVFAALRELRLEHVQFQDECTLAAATVGLCCPRRLLAVGITAGELHDLVRLTVANVYHFQCSSTFAILSSTSDE